MVGYLGAYLMWFAWIVMKHKYDRYKFREAQRKALL